MFIARESMLDLILIALAIYFLIGLCLLIFGPYRVIIVFMHGESKGFESWRLDSNFRKQLRNAMLFWPATILSAVHDAADCRAWDDHVAKSVKDAREGRRVLGTVGGTSRIECLNCGWSSHITSFIHGGSGDVSCSWTGFQCQQCGAFTTVKDCSDDNSVRRCECGGELRRDKFMFCPSCRHDGMRVYPGPIT